MVLQAAVAEATHWRLRHVLMWEPSSQAIDGAELLVESSNGSVRADYGTRTEEVPCVRWHKNEDRLVSLQENQLYAWC